MGGLLAYTLGFLGLLAVTVPLCFAPGHVANPEDDAPQEFIIQRENRDNFRYTRYPQNAQLTPQALVSTMATNWHHSTPKLIFRKFPVVANQIIELESNDLKRNGTDYRKIHVSQANTAAQAHNAELLHRFMIHYLTTKLDQDNTHAAFLLDSADAYEPEDRYCLETCDTVAGYMQDMATFTVPEDMENARLITCTFPKRGTADTYTVIALPQAVKSIAQIHKPLAAAAASGAAQNDTPYFFLQENFPGSSYFQGIRNYFNKPARNDPRKVVLKPWVPAPSNDTRSYLHKWNQGVTAGIDSLKVWKNKKPEVKPEEKKEESSEDENEGAWVPKVHSKNGKTYYYNTKTKETRWENPQKTPAGGAIINGQNPGPGTNQSHLEGNNQSNLNTGNGTQSNANANANGNEETAENKKEKKGLSGLMWALIIGGSVLGLAVIIGVACCACGGEKPAQSGDNYV